MAGRNNRPKKRGPVSHPSDLDQFGQEMADEGMLQGERDNQRNTSEQSGSTDQASANQL